MTWAHECRSRSRPVICALIERLAFHRSRSLLGSTRVKVNAAGVFELIHARHELLATQEHIHDLVSATVVSFIVGYASIAFLLGYLKKHTMWLFIVYRLALGAALLALLSAGKLNAF
jgi:hypothetical protein